MNTKSNNIQINPEYADLFTFVNDKEKHEHNAQMISYKILSEVEKICGERKLKKKDLALKIGTSKSYITQLFRGNKSINTQVMAKFEDVLNMTFQIEGILNEVKTAFIGEQVNLSDFTHKRVNSSTVTWFCCYNNQSRKNNPTGNEMVEKLETDNDNKSQKAA